MAVTFRESEEQAADDISTKKQVKRSDLSYITGSPPEERAMDPTKMTGLALLQAAMAGKIPPASIAETVPMKPDVVEEGYIRIVARADGRHLNPLGGVHGGFAATVLDSVTGCAVHSTLGVGIGYGTVDLQVKMLRPVPKESDLIAEGRLVYASKNVAFAEGTLKTAEGKLLASATATCFIIRPTDQAPQ
ncbi:PaaI family thioesterase [Serratia marcescens]|uniref:PaaI family thioesterase n=2 Tax=Serratia TaxID=613 RepID=UPI00403656E2